MWELHAYKRKLDHLLFMKIVGIESYSERAEC